MNRLSMFCLAVPFVLGALFHSSVAQTTHTVGDSIHIGWQIPSGGAATYATWASQQTFAVGDVLVFNFATGTHDVAEVTKAAFDDCTTSNPISTVTTAPANITLSSTGKHYFICTFPGHCKAGQKLSITVSANSTATPPTGTPPPPSATTTTPQPPPPPPSSAPSLSVMALPVALLSIVLACFN